MHGPSEHAHTPGDASSSIPAQRRALLAGIGGLAAGAVLTRSAHAGPLDPPAGAVASTGKTLTEVEPRIAINSTNTRGDANSVFRISQPGSYYLTGNVTGVSGRHGIEIAASNVSVDLMGFTLRGVPGSLDAIAADGALDNITIRNGNVTSWGSDGVNLGPGGTARACLLENLCVSTNALIGIRAGNHCVIRSCSLIANGAQGILAGVGCTISACVVTENAQAGISAGNACTIDACAALSNLAGGIAAGDTGTISNCTARDNAGFGIFASIASTISRCAALSNAGNGIQVDSGLIEACTAQENTLSGIAVGSRSRVTECVAIYNTLHGISVSENCSVCGCNAAGNGTDDVGAGVYADGNDNRIEANNCADNEIGIQVTTGGCFIARNTCSGSAFVNYHIAASNRYGPIINISAVGTAAAVGSEAPDTLSTTHPWANFSF